MVPKIPIITLLTDFGLHDQYVAVMKGVIWNIQPDAQIVDISHLVPPQNIAQAAYLVKQTYPYFPNNTIHLVVVDPDVGTPRKALLVSTDWGYFLAPDNGVLSYVYATEPSFQVREITASHYFLKPRTGTFDGRDLFAPVAAWMLKGVSAPAIGELLTEYQKFDLPQPVAIQEGIWRCKIVYIDRFGTLVSNLGHEQFTQLRDASKQRRFAFRIGEQNVSKLCQAYAEGAKGEVFAILGSSGNVEFSANHGSAQQLTGVEVGADILLKIV